MRPDQHKQKKSAQYKKKHGFQEKGSSEKERGRGRGGGQGREEEAGPRTDTPPPPTTEQAVRPAVEVPEKRFSRREVISNWTRYEEEGAGTREGGAAASIPRGADFNALIAATSKAAGSLSQFRLQEERDWDVPSPGDTTSPSGGGLEPSPGAAADYLSVNVADLAAAVHCVPLHTRLGLGEDLFGEQQINDFNRDASYQLDAYWSDPKRKQRKPPTVSVQKPQGIPKTDPSDAVTNRPSDTLFVETRDVTHDDSDDRCDVLEEILNLNTDSEGRRNTQNKDESSPSPERRGMGDHESAAADAKVDLAKSRDATTIPTKSRDVTPPTPVVLGAGSHVNAQKQEEELDLLLALDTPVRHTAGQDNALRDQESSDEEESAGKFCSDAVSQTGEKKKGAADLDDWLDSMLGDDE